MNSPTDGMPNDLCHALVVLTAAQDAVRVCTRQGSKREPLLSLLLSTYLCDAIERASEVRANQLVW